MKPTDFLKEDASGLDIGDPVIITGKVQFQGKTGDIVDFGKDKRFVIVNLYNYGKHSFNASDVSYNDYADSDQEEADAYDRDPDARNWMHRQEVGEAKVDKKTGTKFVGYFKGTDTSSKTYARLVGEAKSLQSKFEKHLAKHGYDVAEKSKYWEQKLKDIDAQIKAWDAEMERRKQDKEMKSKEITQENWAKFGAVYAEQLAKKVFDERPHFSTKGRADELVDYAWRFAVQDLGKNRARYEFNYDEDFLSDFVSAYGWLQRGGNAETGEDGQVAEDDELNVGIEAYGVRGAAGKKWRKTFKSQAAFEKWLDANEGDVEVLGTREVNLNDMFGEDSDAKSADEIHQNLFLGSIKHGMHDVPGHIKAVMKGHGAKDYNKVVNLVRKKGYAGKIEQDVAESQPEDANFLKWMRQNYPDAAKSAETYANAKKHYAQHLRQKYKDHPAYKEGVAEGSTTRGGDGGMSASQAHHEIQWLQNKIETLKPLLAKKPSVARQIKDLERQIRERELAIAYQKEGVAEEYDPSYDPEYRPYEKPEQDPDAWKQQRDLEEPSAPSTVTVRDAEGNVVLQFPSTGGYYGDVRTAKAKGFDTEAGDYDIKWQKNEDSMMAEDSGVTSEQVASEIVRRIIVKHKDAITQFGPEAIMAAAREVGEYFAGWEELGTSDIGVATKYTLEKLDQMSRGDLGESASGGATGAGAIATTPAGGAGKNVGSLFGGTYKQKRTKKSPGTK